MKMRTAAGRVPDFNGATMGSNDLRHDSESEAGTVVAVERPRQNRSKIRARSWLGTPGPRSAMTTVPSSQR